MKKIDSKALPDNEKNPELQKMTEKATTIVLNKLESQYGVFSYKQDGQTVKEMPSALKNGSFHEYPEGTFANFANNEEKLPFHNRNHTEKIILRIKEMCKAINAYSLTAQNQEIAITQVVENILILAAIGHDVEQQNDIRPIAGSDNANIRSYYSGDNEIKSADAMKKTTEKKLRSSMLDSQKIEHLLAILESAILETRGSFGPGLSTIQQQFDATRPWQTHLLAFADIGAAGMNSDTFITEGDALLMEVNPFILTAFLKYSKGEEISNSTKKEVEDKIKQWDISQINWAKSREQKFNKSWTNQKTNETHPADIDMVPAEVKKALQPLFSQFGESIKLAEDRQKKRTEMTFEQLAENLGFKKN